MKLHCIKVNDHYVLATPYVALCGDLRSVVESLSDQLPPPGDSREFGVVRGETFDLIEPVSTVQYTIRQDFVPGASGNYSPMPIYRVNVTHTLCDALRELARTIEENLLASR